MRFGEVAARQDPLRLFQEYAFILNQEVKSAIFQACLARGATAFIEEHPDHGLVFHTLHYQDRVFRRPIASYFEALRERPKPKVEAKMQAAFVVSLRTQGIACEEQVRCAVGIADVVDATWVYEVKPSTRAGDVFRAVGQAVLYGAALGRKPCIVLPADPGRDFLLACDRALVRLVIFPTEVP